MSDLKLLAPRGRLLTVNKAKDIASAWHGGQWSALYQFASSGVYLPQNHLRYLHEIQSEIEPEYFSAHPVHRSFRDKQKLRALKNYITAQGEKHKIFTKWEKHPQYGYQVPFLAENSEPKMMEKVENLKLMAKDGAALARERKYTSDQPHEQRYRKERKSRVRYYRTMEIGGAANDMAGEIRELFGMNATTDASRYGMVNVSGDRETLLKVQEEFGGSFDGNGNLMVSMYQHGGCPVQVGQPVKFQHGGESVAGTVSGIEGETASVDVGGREFRLPVDQLELVQYTQFADGGTSTETPRKFLQSLNLSALSEDARRYIRDEMLEDEELDSLTMDDESMKDLYKIFKTKYPDAIKAAPAGEPTGQEIKDAISGLELLLDGASKKEKQEINDAIEGLKLLL